MFFKDNGIYSILCAPRSGHFSLYNYFGLKYLSDIDSTGTRKFNAAGSVGDWLNSKSCNKILVIRNPYSRLQSAIRHTENMNKDKDWTMSHSGLFLGQVANSNIEFKIIKFENFNDYVKEFGNHVMPTVSKCRKWQPAFKEYYTEELMSNEFEAYRKILATKKIISVKEWKKLTQNS